MKVNGFKPNNNNIQQSSNPQTQKQSPQVQAQINSLKLEIASQRDNSNANNAPNTLQDLFTNACSRLAALENNSLELQEKHTNLAKSLSTLDSESPNYASINQQYNELSQALNANEQEIKFNHTIAKISTNIISQADKNHAYNDLKNDFTLALTKIYDDFNKQSPEQRNDTLAKVEKVVIAIGNNQQPNDVLGILIGDRDNEKHGDQIFKDEADGTKQKAKDYKNNRDNILEKLKKAKSRTERASLAKELNKNVLLRNFFNKLNSMWQKEMNRFTTLGPFNPNAPHNQIRQFFTNIATKYEDLVMNGNNTPKELAQRATIVSTLHTLDALLYDKNGPNDNQAGFNTALQIIKKMS
jgi:hypothetical protein